jgi:hypothetical protein
MSRMSRALGYKNPAFLSQMVGANPTREITPITARRIEYAYNLDVGALDDPNFQAPETTIRTVTREEFKEKLKSGKVDPELIKRLYPDLVQANPTQLDAGVAGGPHRQSILQMNLEAARREWQLSTRELVSESVKAVGELLDKEGVTASGSKFAALVSMVLDDAFERETVRTEHIQNLVRLMK